MKLLRAIASLTMIALVDPTLANDSYISAIAGSPLPAQFQSEHPAIRMQSEKAILTLRPDDLFETDANFVFRNDSGQSVTVQMGFPEEDVAADGETTSLEFSGFKKFATLVNGRRVAAKRTRVRNFDFGHWWLKTLSFAPHETKRVRVMATSRLGGLGSRRPYHLQRLISYNFTGGNWKGLVSRSEVEVRVPMAGQWAAYGYIYDANARQPGNFWNAKVKVAGGVAYLTSRLSNWQGQGSYGLSVRRVMPGWMMAPETVHYDKYRPMPVTSRVGRGQGALDVPAPDAWVREGVGMVSFDYLTRITARGQNYSTYDAPTRTATLYRGDAQVSFVQGKKTMRVTKNGVVREVSLPVAPELLMVKRQGKRLYVPLRATAQALGLDFELDVSLHYLRVKSGEQE